MIFQFIPNLWGKHHLQSALPLPVHSFIIPPVTKPVWGDGSSLFTGGQLGITSNCIGVIGCHDNLTALANLTAATFTTITRQSGPSEISCMQ